MDRYPIDPSCSLLRITIMEASDLRQGYHLAHVRWLDSAGVRAIHIERKMGTKSVIIGDVCGEHSSEMPGVEDDDMIEHIATDTPDEPLAVGILPWTARGDLHFFDAQVFDALLERQTVDRVAISQQATWDGIPRKCLDDLLGSPLCDGMVGDVDMHDALPIVRKNQEDEQDLGHHGGTTKKSTETRV